MAQTHSLDLERGSSQYADITGGTGLHIGGDQTIEAWVRGESFISADDWNTIVQRGDLGTNRQCLFGFNAESSTLGLRFGVSSNGSSTTYKKGNYTFAVDLWYHVVAAYTASAGEVKFYVNGLNYDTQTGLPTSIYTSGTNYLGVGGASDLAGAFDGLIKDVRIFNDVRTASEIASDAFTENVSNANLKAEWNFNNAYTDSSGNSNTLTARNSPVFSTTIPWEGADGISGSTYLETSLVSYWKMDEASGTREDAHGTNDLVDNNTVGSATGIINSGADFELSNSEYLNIADGSQTGLDFSGDFSAAFWTNFEQKPSTAGTIFRVLSKTDGSSARAYTVMFNNNVSNGLECECYGDGTTSNRRVGTSPVNTVGDSDVGAWAFWVVAFDVSEGKWYQYKNGVMLTTTSNNAGTVSSVYNTSAPFSIGAQDTGSGVSGYFDGIIDEVGTWSRVLHYGDVLDLYNAGAATPYSSGTAYTKDISESITLAETTTRLTGKAVEEVVELIENINRSLTRTITDVLALAETTTTAFITNKLLTDTITLAETVTSKITAKILTETIELVETTTTRITALLLTGSITLAETTTVIRQYFKTVSESLSLAETTSRVFTFGKHLSDSIGLTDRVRGLLNSLNMLLQNKYAAKAGSYFKKYLDPK